MGDPTRRESTPSDLPTSTRRELLAAATAAAGAGVFASGCTSFGPATFTAPRAHGRAAPRDGEPIQIGIIGVGPAGTPAMGFGHCMSICKLAKDGREKVEIVAISDVCKPALERGLEHCRKEQGIEVEGYRDYERLLARDDLHGVLIATPEHWHSKMAIDAVLSGLDVYLEKPMTLRLEEALKLRAVVQANDRVFQVGTQFLQHAKYAKAKELIASGAIGKPTFSQTSYCRNSKDGEWLYAIDPAVVPGEMLDWERWCGPAGRHPYDPAVMFRWRRYRAWSTGIVGDLLVHVTTPLVFALDAGWPVRVSATGGHYVDTAMENHDQVNLTVDFEQGHTMVIAGSTCNETGLEVLIRGHRANLYLGGNDCVLRPERTFAEEIEEQTFSSGDPGLGDQDLHRLDWLACMRTRNAPRGDVETATKVMAIVDLATRSMWEKSAFTFDPEKLAVRRA
jgi:predicted dehydrogenase